MERSVIEQYEAGAGKLQNAIAGLTSQDLLWAPPPDAGVGLWSIQTIVIHLMDSDLIWGNRMKSIIAEDHPIILGYDETKFAASLFYADQDPQSAISLIDMNRRQIAKTLRKLPDSSFARTGQHNERGPVSLGEAVKIVVRHLDHHLEFAAKKREKLGKPLKG
jgi:hypothetical protein